MRIDDKNMVHIMGGSSGVGATFLNYLSTAFKTVYGIGQGLGGAIRRIATKKVCPI